MWTYSAAGGKACGRMSVCGEHFKSHSESTASAQIERTNVTSKLPASLTITATSSSAAFWQPANYNALCEHIEVHSGAFMLFMFAVVNSAKPSTCCCFVFY